MTDNSIGANSFTNSFNGNANRSYASRSSSQTVDFSVSKFPIRSNERNCANMWRLHSTLSGANQIDSLIFQFRHSVCIAMVATASSSTLSTSCDFNFLECSRWQCSVRTPSDTERPRDASTCDTHVCVWVYRMLTASVCIDFSRKLRLIFMKASIYTYGDKANSKHLQIFFFFWLPLSNIKSNRAEKIRRKDTTKHVKRKANICRWKRPQRWRHRCHRRGETTRYVWAACKH